MTKLAALGWAASVRPLPTNARNRCFTIDQARKTARDRWYCRGTFADRRRQVRAGHHRLDRRPIRNDDSISLPYGAGAVGNLSRCSSMSLETLARSGSKPSNLRVSAFARTTL